MPPCLSQETELLPQGTELLSQGTELLSQGTQLLALWLVLNSLHIGSTQPKKT